MAPPLHSPRACRGEGPAAALELFDAEFRDSEALLGVGGARTARSLEAFVLERSASDDYRCDALERRERAIERAREARRGAFDYLAVEWEELREFLERHGLAEGCGSFRGSSGIVSPRGIAERDSLVEIDPCPLPRGSTE